MAILAYMTIVDAFVNKAEVKISKAGNEYATVTVNRSYKKPNSEEWINGYFQCMFVKQQGQYNNKDDVAQYDYEMITIKNIIQQLEQDKVCKVNIMGELSDVRGSYTNKEGQIIPFKNPQLTMFARGIQLISTKERAEGSKSTQFVKKKTQNTSYGSKVSMDALDDDIPF